MSQVDSEVHHYQVLNEVTYHKKGDSAIANMDGFINSSSGNLHRKRTTSGWKILVEWKDGSVDWVTLKDLEKSNPVDLAEYSMANEISDETAFNWWVKENLWHRYIIISKVKYKYWRTSHKFGIKFPKTVKEAYDIDRQSGNGFGTTAIAKEMTNVRIAFEKFDGVTPDKMRKGNIKHGYEHVNVHRIFDINIDGKFTRK